MIVRLFCAGLVAVTASVATVQPAKAWGGGAFAFGTAVGVTTGVLLSRPYYPYPYAYPYPYYPAPVYAAPPVAYGYAYPPPGYVVPGYPPPAYAAAPAPVPYAAQQPAPQARVAPTCAAGLFFNTLTGNCDRR
jgi:hypothetical protein